MSYNDSYGDEPRRAGRRAAREPSGPAKVQGSTAAAILIFLGIVGFGIGALIGNSGDDDPGTTTAEDTDGVPSGSPDTGSNTDSGESDEPTDDGNDDGQEPSTSITLEMDDSAEAGDELEYIVRIDPPRPGLELGVERRQSGGDWGPFGDPQLTIEIDDDGEKDGHVITGVVGESEWRFVGEIDGQRVESNVVTATITEEDDDDDDDDEG